MDERISEELRRVESEYGVTVLFACESGSRAWGFPSQDSDYDVRFVYAHPLDWYLDLQKHRDVIEKPITDLLDVSGWDLDKTLRLLRKSNPNILEWVQSPIIYEESTAFAGLRSVLDASFNPRASTQHYLNMAINNKRQWLERDEVKIKKYLYAIRPLLCAEWVLKHGSQPPMLYFELLDELHPETRLAHEVRDLVRRKVDMNELDLIPRNEFLNEWIEETITATRAAIPADVPPPDWSVYNGVFRSTCAAAFADY
jgi:predicted nucleotidyltransferase